MEINKKNQLNLLFGILIVFALSSPIMAAMIAPATSAQITSTGVLLNVSNTSITTMNCTFWALSSSTANSTYVLLNTTAATNTTSEDVAIWGYFDSNILEDSNDYSFKASCWNDTLQANSTAVTSVIADNTIPQAASSLSPSDKSIDSDGSITFSGTVTAGNTTGCTLMFDGRNPGTSSYTMTHTGSTCSYSTTNVAEETYNWYIRASDGSNTTDSNTITASVDISSGTRQINAGQQAKSIALAAAQGDGTRNTGMIIIIILVVLVGLFWLDKK